jgi:hypothetical protein
MCEEFPGKEVEERVQGKKKDGSSVFVNAPDEPSGEGQAGECWN